MRVTGSLILILLLSLVVPLDSAITGSKASGTLYAIADDRGTYLGRWDWEAGKWVKVFPEIKGLPRNRNIPELPGPVGGPAVAMTPREFFIVVEGNLTHVVDGMATVLLGDDISHFCYNPEKRLLFVVANDTLKAYSWPGLEEIALANQPPLGYTEWPTVVSSRGERVVIGGNDGRVYLAKVGEYRFKPVTAGICPTLSPSGRYLAFSIPDRAKNRMQANVMDLQGTLRKSIWLEAGLPEPAWLGVDSIVYAYEWKLPAPLMLYPVHRFWKISIATGKREEFSLNPDFMGTFTWVDW